MKRGVPYFDLWALTTKSDLNEEELSLEPGNQDEDDDIPF